MAQPPEDGRARDILERGSSNQRPVQWSALPDRARAMALPLRFTAPSSDYRDWLDYTIVEDGRRDVGRLYEDRLSRPELRWFWSITVYIKPNLGITASGRAPTMNEAKEHFLRNWQKCRTVSSLARRPAPDRAPDRCSSRRQASARVENPD